MGDCAVYFENRGSDRYYFVFAHNSNCGLERTPKINLPVSPTGVAMLLYTSVLRRRTLSLAVT